MTRIEPRIAERRRRVREQGARQGLGRLLGLLVGVGILATAAWLLQSPWLSLGSVEVEGAARADVEHALGVAGVREGMPLVAVRASRAEEALEADPWVREARVAVRFPETLEVEVTERSPVASLRVGDRWMLVAGDGTLLAPTGEPRGGRVTVGGAEATHPGERVERWEVRAALEFVGALRPELAAATEVTTEEGELWATVAGHRVRLGLAEDMPAKAAALEAVLARGVPEGAVIDVLAPARPTVRNP